MTDSIGAVVAGIDVRIAGAAQGPLAGLTFAAKDLCDVAGYPTAGGNPDWAAYNPVPTRHAWAVQTLLDAGAMLVGKTIAAPGLQCCPWTRDGCNDPGGRPAVGRVDAPGSMCPHDLSVAARHYSGHADHAVSGPKVRPVTGRTEPAP